MRDPGKPALLAFSLVFVLGVVGLLAAAALDERRLAFTLGVQPAQVAAVLQPGQTVCQGPIDVPADARTVRFPVGTFGTPGPRLEVFTRTAGGIAGRDVVPAGYADRAIVAASPGGIEAGTRIALCVRNAGREQVSVLGGVAGAARTSIAKLDGNDTLTDLTLIFERGESRSMLAALGDAFERAALFHPSWVSTGLLWVLAVLLLAGLPVALLMALRASYSSRP